MLTMFYSEGIEGTPGLIHPDPFILVSPWSGLEVIANFFEFSSDAILWGIRFDLVDLGRRVTCRTGCLLLNVTTKCYNEMLQRNVTTKCYNEMLQ